ncbi:MAG: hypothetical protein V4721_13530 [Bacteroidota bacterium]
MKLQFTRSKLEQSLKAVIVLLSLMALYLNSSAQTIMPDKVNIGLIYPISTNGTHAAADTNLFSFNLLAGLSAAEHGLTFAGFSNVVRHEATGLQFAGFSNHVGKKATGMMFAGFMNTYGEARGLQFAGFTNIAVKNVEGAQFAGFLNRAADVKGTQIGGFSNVSRDIKGTQIGGFSNVARRVDGTQIAGFTNTAGDIKGSQIAGFINVAKKIKGVQLSGFMNIADSSDHPIGFINIIKNGEKSVGFSVDDTRTAMASFRSGGKILYGIIGAGYNFKNDEEVYAFELGLGAHLINSPVFRINAEVSTMTLESFWSGEYFKSSFKLMPSIRPVKFLEIFGGPVFNYVNTNTSEGRALTEKYIQTWENRWGNNFEGIYVGYTGGINILF